MTTHLSNRVLSMQESATLAMAQKSRELKRQGKDIISLSLGEPDFDTPQNIKDAAKTALDNRDTKYPPVNGTLALREAICKKFETENGLNYIPNNIVVSTGAKQSIANVCLALLNEGDEVILPTPYWVSYFSIAQLAEANVVEVLAGVEQDFKPTASQIEEKITNKTKIIIYSSPSNPTGSVYSYDELKKMVELLKKYPKIHIISDEIYEHLNYTGKHHSIAEFDEIKDRVIVVNGFSKAYAMTGWRLGYIAASEEIAKACTKIQGQVTSGACSFNQAAGIEALLGSQEGRMKMLENYKTRRELVLKRLSEFDKIKCSSPEGAFYVFPDISAYFGTKYGSHTINNSDDMAMYLLEEVNVATVGGKSFGDDKCIRLSFATSEELLNEAFDRIGEALGKLN